MEDFNWNKSLCEIELSLNDNLLVGQNCVHNFYDNKAGYNTLNNG